jgi:hypothetical protein
MDHTKLRELAEHAESVRKANADMPTRRLAMEQSDAEQEWFSEVPPSVVLALLDELDALRGMLPTAEEREALEECASYALYSGSIRERSASCAAFAFLTRPEPATGAAVPTMEELDRLAADRLKAMQSLNDLGESERSACDAAHDAHKAACRRAGKDSAQQYADWFHNRRASTASGAQQTPVAHANAPAMNRVPPSGGDIGGPSGTAKSSGPTVADGAARPDAERRGTCEDDSTLAECEHHHVERIDADWGRCLKCGDETFPLSAKAAGGMWNPRERDDDVTKAAEAMREACAEICEDRRAYLRGLDSRYHAKATADLAEMAREIRALPLPKTTRNTDHAGGGAE